MIDSNPTVQMFGTVIRAVNNTNINYDTNNSSNYNNHYKDKTCETI